MTNFKERYGNVFLENAQKKAEEQPDTFSAPDIETLKDLKKGDAVQICFYKTIDGHGIRPWLDVVGIRADEIKCHTSRGFDSVGIPVLEGTIFYIPYRFICDYRNDEKEIAALRNEVTELIDRKSNLFKKLEQKNRKLTSGEYDKLVELHETITSFVDRIKALEEKHRKFERKGIGASSKKGY